MSFNKVCKICGVNFKSESSSTKYCSDKCKKKGAKKLRRSRKMKHIKALQRGDDSEISSLIAEAYRLSRKVAKLTLAKKCVFTKEDHSCEGELEVHHKDHNPFNARPENLCWVCEKAHKEIHSIEEDCSVIDELKAYITIRKQSEIRERNRNKV